MMVVVAIIALLLAVLLPAFGIVRDRARQTQAQSMFSGIDAGLQTFRGEAALANLPPSAADNPDPLKRQLIANPRNNNNPPGNGGKDPVRVSGGMLLVHAMVGADGLGTPGFRDLNRNGFWWDDSHDGAGGLYELDADRNPKQPRYGGAGFVDDKMKERLRSLQDLQDRGIILNLAAAPTNTAVDELMFVDPWEKPILYYRANRAAVNMVGESGKPGIYWQEDNGIITGTEQGLFRTEGIDFGAGKVDGFYHEIVSALPPSDPDPQQLNIGEDDAYDHSFARFIWDPSVKVRYTPVNKDSFLLISAGSDGRYGTDDDITNWTRKEAD